MINWDNLNEKIQKANQAEADELDYQQELQLWELTLADGLANDNPKRLL